MLEDWFRFRRKTSYERRARLAPEAGLKTGCICVLLVVTLGGWHLYEITRVIASADWQKTTGLVVFSQSAPGNLVSSLSYADVEYTYTAQQRTYKSRNLHWVRSTT